MLIASAERFGPGGSWYDGDGYRRYPFFAERAAWINEQAPAGKLLIAGCGWGFLVEELVQLGRDAWGIDAAAYCIERAAIPGRILQRSVLVRADLNAARSAAGLSGNTRFAAGVTEDLLPCLAVSELASALGEMRRACSVLLHIVTPGSGDPLPPGRAPEMTWRTTQQWKDLVGSELVRDAETGAVL